jgi:hypothetical protein
MLEYANQINRPPTATKRALKKLWLNITTKNAIVETAGISNPTEVLVVVFIN